MKNILTKIAAGLLAFSGIFPSVQGMNDLSSPEYGKRRCLVRLNENTCMIVAKKQPQVGEKNVIHTFADWCSIISIMDAIPSESERNKIEVFIIHFSITNLVNFGLERCPNLRELYIFSDLQMAPFEFSNCHNLTKVYAPHLTKVNRCCFCDCENLKEVLISESAHIPLNAFGRCKNLRELLTCKNPCCFPGASNSYENCESDESFGYSETDEPDEIIPPKFDLISEPIPFKDEPYESDEPDEFRRYSEPVEIISSREPDWVS